MVNAALFLRFRACLNASQPLCLTRKKGLGKDSKELLALVSCFVNPANQLNKLFLCGAERTCVVGSGRGVTGGSVKAEHG